MALYINEWFPNPVGVDSKTEFIELFNSGKTAVSLDGLFLVVGKKKFSLSGHVMGAQGYLLLKRDETKLDLKNSDASIFLYASSGKLIDGSSFTGMAPEGKSFSRVDYGPEDTQHFAFLDPTPGAPNKTIDARLVPNTYPFNVPFEHKLDVPQFFSMMMGVAIVLSGLLLYSIRTHETLSKLFFGRNETRRREAGQNAHKEPISKE